MKKSNTTHNQKRGCRLHLSARSGAGSVLVVTLAMVTILALIVGVTLKSTSNKYLTAYQSASWQEALQGAETGADIAMAEMRKDTGLLTAPLPVSSPAPNPSPTPFPPAFAGWVVGTYDVNGKRDVPSESPIGADGYFTRIGTSSSKKFTLAYLNKQKSYYVRYNTQLTPHAGEGNTDLRVDVIMDAPTSLVDAGDRQWLRVRSTGTTALVGGQQVSEEKLDNRLRKIGIFFDKMLGKAVSGSQGVASRRIEVIAKPVTMFAGAIMTQCNFRNDKAGITTNSFNSEGHNPANPSDPTYPWPYNVLTGEYDLSKSLDPNNPIGKNGDVDSNAFPDKHDHNSTLAIKGDSIFGDVGNNYSPITGWETNYFTNKGIPNPNPKLITQPVNGIVSGDISANFYRDLPRITKPTWPLYTSINTVDSKNTAAITAGPAGSPTRYKIGSINLGTKDTWQINQAVDVNGKPVPSEVEIWVTGDIKLDDGGKIVINGTPDLVTGEVNTSVRATIYFEGGVKVGTGGLKETKTLGGGFDVVSDDAKDLLLLGIDQPPSGKKDDNYDDPISGTNYNYSGNKKSGDLHFHETDFTGAIYAPDHNIIIDNSKDGKGKRRRRKQLGNEFYGSFVGRTIHVKGPTDFHYDESLNDVGPVRDWGYISWFEDVDVDNR